MLKKTIYCFLALALTSSLMGCTSRKQEIQQSMKELQSHKIEIPFSSMLCYRAHERIASSGVGTPYKLVIYTDSVQCSPCALNHLYEYDDILDSLHTHSNKLSTVFIFSPKSGEQHEFKKKVMHQEFRNKVYVDTCGAFAQKNPHIPANVQMHSFLLDNKDSVILVGNPLANPQIRELYRQVLSNI